jgi:hypothetical protein
MLKLKRQLTEEEVAALHPRKAALVLVADEFLWISNMLKHSSGSNPHHIKRQFLEVGFLLGEISATLSNEAADFTLLYSRIQKTYELIEEVDSASGMGYRCDLLFLVNAWQGGKPMPEVSDLALGALRRDGGDYPILSSEYEWTIPVVHVSDGTADQTNEHCTMPPRVLH